MKNEAQTDKTDTLTSDVCYRAWGEWNRVSWHSWSYWAHRWLAHLGCWMTKSCSSIVWSCAPPSAVVASSLASPGSGWSRRHCPLSPAARSTSCCRIFPATEQLVRTIFVTEQFQQMCLSSCSRLLVKDWSTWQKSKAFWTIFDF